MDKLQQRSEAFRKLMKYEYVIKLGRKGVLQEIRLDFQKSDFFHLIGLHKLNDLRYLKQSTERTFDECLKGIITYSMIRESKHFDELGYRFEYFDRLEKILDNNNLIFRCNKNSMQMYSSIEADYMLQENHENLVFYLFTAKRFKSDIQCCKSFFENSVVDYTRGQMKMALLYKEKINKYTGESIVQYNRL